MVELDAGSETENHGDLHFRRTDNGNGMFNPFVGNTILDPFTTEIGAEVYVRADGMLAMLAATSGEVKGQVTAPQINAEVINPFVKIGGLELFGSFETATGGAFAEPKLRTLHQNVYEGLFRFANDQL